MTGDFEREIAKVRPHMLRFALRLTRDQSEAEDVVQFASISVWRNFAGIERSKFKAYCLTAVMNRVRSNSKSLGYRIERQMLDDFETLAQMGKLDPDPFADQFSDRLSAALGSVPATYRRIIEMVADDATIRDVAAEFGLIIIEMVADDATIRDVAAEFGLIEATAKTRMYRARELMKAALA